MLNVRYVTFGIACNKPSASATSYAIPIPIPFGISQRTDIHHIIILRKKNNNKKPYNFSFLFPFSSLGISISILL